MRRRFRGSSLFWDVEIGGESIFQGDLNAAGGTFGGALTAATGTFAGDLSAAGGTFTGDLSAAGGTFTGDLSAAGGTFTGTLTAVDGEFTGTLTGVDGDFSGDISGASGTFTGDLSGGSINTAAFHVDATGQMWLGHADYASAPFKVSAAGALSATSFTLSGSGMTIGSDGTIAGATIGTSTLNTPTVNAPNIDGSGQIVDGGQITSDVYTPGSVGWAIDGDGNVEFNDGTFRGDILADSFATGVDGQSTMFILIGQSGSAGDDELQFQDRVGSGNSYAGFTHSYGGAGVYEKYLSLHGHLDNPATFGEPSITFATTHNLTTGVRIGDGYINFNAGAYIFDSGGNATFQSERVDIGSELYLGDWTSTSYQGLFHSGLTSAYMMMSNGTDTYVGADASVYIRPGTNVSTYQWEFTDGGKVLAPGANVLTYSFGNDTNTGFGRVSADIAGIYAAGGLIMQFGSGGVFAPGMRTTTAPGLVVERFPSSGNELYGETSSGELKADQQDAHDMVGKLLSLRPRMWTALAKNADGTIETLDTERKETNRGTTFERPGFIVEEMADVWPEAVIFDGDDRPVGLDRMALITALIQFAKQVDARLAAAGL